MPLISVAPGNHVTISRACPKGPIHRNYNVCEIIDLDVVKKKRKGIRIGLEREYRLEATEASEVHGVTPDKGPRINRYTLRALLEELPESFQHIALVKRSATLHVTDYVVILID